MSNGIEDFRNAINDTVMDAQVKAVNEFLSGFSLSDEIRETVKAELLSRICYGMNLQSVEIYKDSMKNKEILIFKVEL